MTLQPLSEMVQPMQFTEDRVDVLVDDNIVKDYKRVYISGVVKPHLHALTFRKIGSAYYVDKDAVYWGEQRVEGADQKSFRVLGKASESFMAVDKSSVYLSGRAVKELDALPNRAVA